MNPKDSIANQGFLRERLSRMAGPPSPRLSILRAFLAGAVALTLVVFFAGLNKELQLEFELWVEQGDRTEIFYSIAGSHYEPLRNREWIWEGGKWQHFDWAYRGYQPLTGIRIDPIASPGEIRIREVSLRSRWAEESLQGSELHRRMVGLNHLEITDVTTDRLHMVSTGIDPHFTVEIPQAFYWPGLARLLPVMAVAFAAGTLAWLLLEGLAGLFRFAFPATAAVLASKRPLTWTLVVLFCALLTYQASFQITDRHIRGDAVQNLQIAYNIHEYNTFSHQNRSDPPPTNFREPVPPALNGLYLKLFAHKVENPSFHQLRVQEGRFVKLSNLFWVFLGTLGIWLLAFRATRRHLMGFAATLLTFHFFFGAERWVNTLYTELPTAALLVWASYLLLTAVQNRSILRFLLAGLLIGLLALTKAVLFFVGAAAIVLLGLFLWMDRNRPTGAFKGALLPTMVMLIGFSMVVTPWILRSQALFDTAEVSQRGGQILYGRGTMNSMSNDEVIGAFYLYGPLVYRKAVEGTALGPTGDDFQRGGRWQRLNRGPSDFAKSDLIAQSRGRPEDAISFHRRQGAIYNKLMAEYAEAGHPFPDFAVEDYMKKEGLRMIRERPFRHLFMTSTYLWRGFWGFATVELPSLTYQRQRAVIDAVNLVSGLALAGLFLIAVVRLRVEWIAMTILPIGMIAFYALLTHNIPRYLAPTHPLMLLALVLTLYGAWHAIRSRKRSRPAVADPAVVATPPVSDHRGQGPA